MNLVEAIYLSTVGFPKNEVYGLAVQMRRAAVSIPSNIAEGSARNSTREYFQYLGVATGSLAELETQLEVATRLKYLSPDAEVLKQVHRVGRLVNSLRNSFETRVHSGERR
jgi:four helix bundle protein